MKIAYLVLAHNTPNHVGRLIHALASPSANFFLHIDKKEDIRQFEHVASECVQLSKKRVSVFWGDFSQVEAILVLLQTAFQNQQKFDRFVLLSGADYPLKSAMHIEKYFEVRDDIEFLNMVEMPSVKAGKPIVRLTRYQLRPGDGRLVNWTKRILMKLSLLPRQRDYKDFLVDMTPFGGSTWWAITHSAAKVILDFVRLNPEFVSFFKNTVCPDEAFFQTIVGNSYLKSKISRNLTYTDWSAGGRSPEIISSKHIEFFSTNSSFPATDIYGPGEMLFARKFPDNSDELVHNLQQTFIE